LADEEDEKVQKDPRVEEAKVAIREEIAKQRVVTDREIKVRLETRFFPWVTGRGMMQLLESEEVEKHGYAGRRRTGGGMTEKYYSLKDVSYDEIRDLIQLKREVSGGIVAILTGEAAAGAHAEDLFDEVFETLGFKIHGRDVSKFNGKEIKGEVGKEPGNLDFVVERDNVVYGVDVKNWIRYEADTREEVRRKVRFALELGTQPFIIARYLDQDTIYTEINAKGGIAYRYVRLLVPEIFESLAVRAKELLGYPMLATDKFPDYSVKWVEKLHLDNLERLKRKQV
jgi:hypothetical protein